MARFLKAHRVIWLVLFSLSVLWAPVAILNFVGYFTWLSAPTALFSFLGLFVLAITNFVCGRWDVRYPDGRKPKASDENPY